MGLANLSDSSVTNLLEIYCLHKIYCLVPPEAVLVFFSFLSSVVHLDDDRQQSRSGAIHGRLPDTPEALLQGTNSGGCGYAGSAVSSHYITCISIPHSVKSYSSGAFPRFHLSSPSRALLVMIRAS